MNDLKKKERELYIESVMLKEAYMELSKKKGTYDRCRNLKKKQDKIYHRQQFYKNLIKEMEK
jgi:elongation factor P--beta-lysine ligase